MSQVIGNIISNSYKYADTKIDISYDFSGNYLEMIIKDYGEGVAPEEIELLTNKFYRGRKNTAGKDGSGLGLYISSELMKKMQGQLICINDKEGFEEAFNNFYSFDKFFIYLITFFSHFYAPVYIFSTPFKYCITIS